jgi:hypothetical protein
MGHLSQIIANDRPFPYRENPGMESDPNPAIIKISSMKAGKK